MQNVPQPQASITPYMAWNRLESRPRKKQFDRVLKAEIHDPLWMLGRQWQMGEYQGNDTGSGIVARVQMDYFKIAGIAPYGQSPQPYNQDLPIEPIVESIPYNWSKKERILMGKKWLQILKATVTTATYNTYKPLFESYSNPFAMQFAEPQPASSDPDTLSGAEIYSNSRLTGFLAAISLAALKTDGAAVYKFIRNTGTWAGNLQTAFANTSLTAAVISTDLSAARSSFLSWMDQMYTFPDGNANWDGINMEYKIDTYWPVDGNNQICLSIPRYHQGHLDWFSLTQTNDPVSSAPVPTTKALQLILSKNRFAGMPSSRWWEFENGAVNFGNLDGNTTDIAKIVMTQFALVYQDDWFVIPYKVPVGSYSEVKGIVVTDVFGVNTFIANYPIKAYTASGFSDANSDEWKSWRWLDVTKQVINNAAPANSSKPAGAQVILPMLNDVMQSKPLESVLFFRDEVADMAWAIEKTVPDQMGRGKDGYENSRAFLEYIKAIREQVPSLPGTPPDPDAKLSYELGANDIPENWIPFTPVHTNSGNRKIKFQRAAMPRIMDKYAISLIRPRTQILRPDTGGQYQPYLIHEQEIPKAGAILELSLQRTRWYNGKIVSWIGLKKTVGRGQGSSGLTYDRIIDLQA